MRLLLELKKGIARAYYRAAQIPLQPILRYEWSRRSQRRLNERPVEYAFALKCLADLSPTRVLDVGTGTTAWPQLLADCGYEVTAIDEGAAYWGYQPVNRHHRIDRRDITSPSVPSGFDAVTCLSVIEHIDDHIAAIRGMRSALEPGGHAILSFPYNERTFVDNVYTLPDSTYGQDAPYICRVYSRAQIDQWLETGLELVDQVYFRVFSGELWTFGERLRPPVLADADAAHHLTCILLRAV